MPALRRINILIAVTAALVLAACVRQPSHEAHTSVATVDTRDASSLYDLTGEWRDQDAASRTLASFRGRPVVLATIYTRCSASCPLTLAEMKRIEAATDARVALVFVSLDGEADTPVQLAQYAREHGLTSPRWTLLNGSDDAVRDITVALGVRYRRLSRDEIAHSNLVTLLDENGAIVTQHAGVTGADSVVAAARALGR